MVERQKAVAEVIVVLPDFNPIAASVFIHPRKSCLRIRFPWVEHVHVVFWLTYFAQILDSIIVLIAVDMVNLLLRPATFTDRPDGMVHRNINPSFIYITVYA